MTWRVRVEPANGAAFDRALEGTEITVGRSLSSGLVVHDDSVSRHHMRLFARDSRWWVEDLGTTNGTRLNGKRLNAAALLDAGDRISIGASRIEVVAPHHAEAEALEPTVETEDADLAESKRQAARLETLIGVHRALARPISLSELLDLILQRCFAALQPEEGLILLRGADGELRRAATRRLPHLAGHVFVSRRIVDEVVTHGTPIVVVDAAVDERFADAPSVVSAGVRSVVAAPLTDAEGTIGMIALSSSLRMRQFSQADLDMLESLASAAVLRVRNMALSEQALERRVIDRELSLAHDMQMSMLPRRRPERTEVEVGATLRPARSVGGDLYDFVLHGDRLWFIVADVSGKGLAASLYMAVAKTLFRASVHDDDTGVADVLARMNRELCRENDQMVFVTAIVGHLMLATGSLVLGDAGHNPPILIDPDGGVSQPPVLKNIALGVLPDATFKDSSWSLSRGATALIYTDGATDARAPSGEMFGSAGLDRVVSACVDPTPQQFVDDIAETIAAFGAGAAPEDDLTLLAIKYVGSADWL